MELKTALALMILGLLISMPVLAWGDINIDQKQIQVGEVASSKPFTPVFGNSDKNQPTTGSFLKDTSRGGRGKLTIINDNHKQDALIVLTNTNKKPQIAVFVRSGDSFMIPEIDDGTYYIYFQQGNDWDSGSAKFKENADYYRFDTPIDFKTTETLDSIVYSTWEVALEEPVQDPNRAARKEPVAEEDFPL